MSEAPDPPPPIHAEEEWQRWRTRTLTRLLWITAAACFTLGVIATIQVRSVPFAIVSGITSSLMLMAAVARALDFRVRAAILVLALFSGTTAALMLGGLSPNILVAMCGCVVMSTLLLGPRWGVGALAIATASVAVLVPLRNANAFPTDLHISYDHPDARALVRVIVGFAFLSSAIVASISYLLARAEELFVQKGRALQKLEEEEARRRDADDGRARAEAAFRKAQELEILGRLSSSVAHDFNNALLIIQANADLARLRPSHVDEALRDIGAAVRQATATTRQLRAFSPQAQRPPRPVSLAETLAREASLLQKVLPANIALRYERPDEPRMVLGDEGQIQSILTNLALNARDAMPEGGSLEMRLRAASPEEAAELAPVDGRPAPVAAIDVIDTGVGMSRETAARIFEPFFTTKGAAGSGLGLSSVRTIVEKAGGRVHVASALGEGSHFRILWPLLAEEATTAPDEEEESAGPSSGTVLVVDDDAAVRSAIARSLTFRGYTVLEAGTGEDALLVGRRHHAPVDVLCVDMVLPGMPPRHLVESFRASHPDVRVLLCSGYVPEEIGGGIDAVDRFLPKPFSPGTLAVAVRDLVQQRRGKGAAAKTA